jgi:hypothetical protein
MTNEDRNISVDEIKFYVASNYAAQDRCVTLSDYIARVNQIGGKFGAPFRTWGQLQDNKVKLYILSKDANGKLNNISNSYIKNNLVDCDLDNFEEYLYTLRNSLFHNHFKIRDYQGLDKINESFRICLVNMITSYKEPP